MNCFANLLIAAVLALSPGLSSALDRLHFKDLADKDLEFILIAFSHVNVHYLLTPAGDSIMSVIKTPSPKVNGLTNAGMLMYFNPKDAETAKTAYEKSTSLKAVIRTAPATKIIRAQFARRNAAPATNPNETDFIIFASVEPKIDVIEYFVFKNGDTVGIKGTDGKDIVPAFLARTKAIEVQTAWEKKGKKIDRIGIDERSFVQFVVAQSKKGRYVQVEGY